MSLVNNGLSLLLFLMHILISCTGSRYCADKTVDLKVILVLRNTGELTLDLFKSVMAKERFTKQAIFTQYETVRSRENNQKEKKYRDKMSRQSPFISIRKSYSLHTCCWCKLIWPCTFYILIYSHANRWGETRRLALGSVKMTVIGLHIHI